MQARNPLLSGCIPVSYPTGIDQPRSPTKLCCKRVSQLLISKAPRWYSIKLLFVFLTLGCLLGISLWLLVNTAIHFCAGEGEKKKSC